MSWDPIKLKASVDELKQILPEAEANIVAGLLHAAQQLLAEHKICINGVLPATITFEKK